MAKENTLKPKRYWDTVLEGVLIALTEIDRAGQQTLFDQIVRDVGEGDLIRVARKRGELKFTGLSRYLKDKRTRAALGMRS